MESAPILPPSDITALILAGGEGRRMGGQDKGLVMWHGKPLVAWMATLVRPWVSRIIISCNRHQDQYRLYADEVIRDDADLYTGPLAGIAKAATYVTTSWCLILPCDMPRLTAEVIRMLIQAADMDHPILVADDGQCWQALVTLMNQASLGAFAAQYAAGARSPLKLLRQYQASPIPIHAEGVFDNLNCLKDMS